MALKHNLYEVLFESIQEGLVLVNDRGVIILCNPTCTKLFGYTEDELIGENIEILVPTHQRENHHHVRSDYHKDPKQRGMAMARHLNGQRKDKTLFPVEVSLNPFVDLENGKRYVAALVSDVSIKRESEDKLIEFAQNLEVKVEERTKELWQSEQLYKSIARNFPGGVISIFDRSLRYLFAEGQGLFELGIETADLIGQDYISRMDGATAVKVKNNLDKVFEGEQLSFEVEVGKFTYLINAVPLVDNEGKIDRILVVEKNITPQKQAEIRLVKNFEKERELNEMKSRFVSMASHEFRTPLTTINSSAGLIQNYLDKGMLDKTPKHIDRIRNAVRNLTSILNDFLSIEKLESGKINVNLIECKLYETITEVIEEFDQLKKKGQLIKVNGEKELSILIDHNILKNIMINLISNALKYSNENGVVNVRFIDFGNSINLEVSDNGIGIPEKDKLKMFERFFRAGNVTNIEGTGLGLTIVKRYLDILGGEIDFESEEGKGTIFKINIPKITTNE
jgi:PAS domain S-box-containing protein